MAAHTDETSEYNWDATRKMADLGLKGLQIPEEYGGADMDTISATIATEELARACGSTSLAISAHNCLGMGPINDFGTEAQKEKWLPILTSKEGRLGCLTLTEPGAGSDLRNIKTKVTRS